MTTKEQHPNQAELAGIRAPTRPPRGPLEKLTLGAFFGYAFMTYMVFLYALFVAKVFIPPIVIEASLMLLAAVVLATRWRYAPYLGAVVALLTLYDPIFQPHNLYVYTHPGQSSFEFSLLLLIVAFGLVSLSGCVSTIISRFRGQGTEPRLPRGASHALSAFAGIVVGAILLSTVITIVPQTSAASTSSGGQPVVHMTASNFVQNVVLVPKGESLLIVNDSSVEHVLQNGAWDTNGSAHPQAETGAPTLRNVDFTNGSKTIGPFPIAGVYHIYCSLHPGMNLTVVVQ